MALKLFHKILIGSAIGLGVLLVAYTGYRYLALGDTSLAASGLIGGVGAIGLAFYLRWFLGKRAR